MAGMSKFCKTSFEGFELFRAEQGFWKYNLNLSAPCACTGANARAWVVLPSVQPNQKCKSRGMHAAPATLGAGAILWIQGPEPPASSKRTQGKASDRGQTNCGWFGDNSDNHLATNLSTTEIHCMDIYVPVA